MKAKGLITTLLLIIFLTHEIPAQRGKSFDAWEIVKVGIIETMAVHSTLSPKELTEREMEILLAYRKNGYNLKFLTCTEQVILIIGAKRIFHKRVNPKVWYTVIIGAAIVGGALTDVLQEILAGDSQHKVLKKVYEDEIKEVITQILGKP